MARAASGGRWARPISASSLEVDPSRPHSESTCSVYFTHCHVNITYCPEYEETESRPSPYVGTTALAFLLGPCGELVINLPGTRLRRAAAAARRRRAGAGPARAANYAYVGHLGVREFDGHRWEIGDQPDAAGFRCGIRVGELGAHRRVGARRNHRSHRFEWNLVETIAVVPTDDRMRSFFFSPLATDGEGRVWRALPTDYAV